eukprot:TRINITY_DN826_c1_g1_i1.p1 TRINITY_DN826_c1_g1~~TRINITY_DN826_c1_g1_i1.p1  ORF type:complete len:1830 (+),score=264.46 TRINITY_DN826_c1_g1_i1:54-5543(+)
MHRFVIPTLCVVLFIHLNLFSCTTATNISLVASGPVAQSAFVGDYDYDTGLWYLAGPSFLFEWDPTTAQITTQLAVPAMPVEFTSMGFPSDPRSVQVVRWKRDGLFDRKFVVVCNDAMMFVALLDSNGLSSNQTLVPSVIFDLYPSNLGTLKSCAAHINQNGMLQVWAFTKEGDPTPGSATFYQLSPISVESLNQPGWVSQKYLYSPCPQPLAFIIKSSLNTGVFTCDGVVDAPFRSFATFSLNQPADQTVLTLSGISNRFSTSPLALAPVPQADSLFLLTYSQNLFAVWPFSWNAQTQTFDTQALFSLAFETPFTGRVDPLSSRLFTVSQTSNSALWQIRRASTTGFEVLATIPTRSLGQVVSFAVDGPRNRAYLVTRNSTLGTVGYEILQLATCPASGNCSACLSADKIFCSWCATTSSASCSYLADCQASAGVRLRLATCPVPTEANPPSAASTGGSVVTMYGTALVNDSSTSCIFSGSSFNSSSSASYQIDGSVTCVVPEAPTAGSYALRLGYGSAPISDNALAFTYYDCSQFTNCSACAAMANKDCVWCALDAVCSSRFTRPNVCPTPFAAVVDSSADTVLKCARLLSASPPSELDTPPAGSKVTISASYLVNSTSGWECQFGDFAVVPAAVDLLASTISCDIPAHPQAPFRGSISLSVLYRSTPYALNVLDFYYYNCGLAATDCSACVNAAQPRCSWCLSQKACLVVGSSSAQTCPDLSASQCPSTTPIPGSSYFNEQAVVTIVSGPFTSVAANTYQCDFGTFGVVVATRINTTALQCTAPSVALGGLSIVDTPLTIIHNNTIYSRAPLPFRFYDCSGTNCSSCAGTLMPKCSWCFSEAYCDLETVVSGSSCAAPVTRCPQVTSLSSTVAAAHGNLTLDVVGTRFFSTLSYNCTFVSSNSSVTPVTVVAQYSSTTQLKCTTPAFAAAGDWSVNVFSGAQLLESPLPLRVINCNQQTQCSACTQTSQCSWCPAVPFCAKTGIDSCSSGIGLNSCPTISSAAPNASEIWRPRSVIVEGTLLDRAVFGNSIDSLVCTFGPSFDDLAPSTQVVGPVTGLPALQCQTPLQPTPFSVNVGVSIIDLNGRVVPYVSGPSFEFFDCRRALDCTTCSASASSRCGWCLSSDSCTPSEQCPTQFWTRSSCPIVVSVQPTFADISAETLVTVTGTRFDAGFDLMCSFDGSTVNATVISETQVTCTPPRRGSAGFASVSIVKRGQQASFSATSATFEYISCNRNSPTPLKTCRSCIPPPDSRCGWCLLDQKCAPQSSCVGSAANVTYLTAACPSISSVSPTSAIGPNSTTIIVTGSLFQQVAGLTCKFGNLLAPSATVLNSSAVACVTPTLPSLSSDQAVQLTLVVDGNEFAEGSLGFTFMPYNPPQAPFNSSNVPTQDGGILSDRPPAWIFVIIALAIVIVIAIAVAVIVIYIRRRRSESQLTPPDYDAIAYANNTRLMYTIPTDRAEKVLDIAPLLLANNFKIPIMLASMSSAGEDDLLSRALVFATLKSGRALDLLLALIDHEIEVANVEQEGELFRSNSLACKCFTVYSKVIGLEWLWKTLARAVNSLNHAGELEDAKAGKAEAGEAPLADVGLLEVDPERLAEKLEQDVVDANILAEVASSQYQLLLYCGRIFKRLVDSMDNVPHEFRTVAARVKQGVAKKFTKNNADYKAVGAFFFLRFVCPAVMTPQVYGLLANPPAETSQRYFVLISKVLQNLANETLPGDKEEYMAPMNGFVQENLDSLHKLIEDLADDSGNDPAAHELARNVPADIYGSSLAHLHTFMVEHDDDMDKKFGRSDDSVQDIRTTTNDIGPVFKSQSSAAAQKKKKGK